MLVYDGVGLCYPWSTVLIKNKSNATIVQPTKDYDFCSTCNITSNSASQADMHYKGKKHLEKVAQLRGGGTPRVSRAGGTCFDGSYVAV